MTILPMFVQGRYVPAVSKMEIERLEGRGLLDKTL